MMAAPIEIKYRAFISYSHRDVRWAKRLHGRLEGFRIDKDLVGRSTSMGSVPNTLRPIFRDRDEFTAGGTLSEQTRTAIDASAGMIVLCSRAAAVSQYVNEEVRLFKSEHPARPIIPVVLDGTPGDPQAECFPQALRCKVGTDGSITGDREEVLAADMRKAADGRNLALAKIVARLLGLGTDEVFRRAERARRRSVRTRIGVSAALAVLVMSSAAIALYKNSVAQREEGLKLVSAAYELLYRDPSAAFLKAHRASTFLSDAKEWQPALNNAYKVAVLHHYNRREISQISGSGPSYLAARWKQGDVFTKASPDGRHRLIVTERGQDGPSPPGDVYLLNNEALRTTKLQPCFGNHPRVEDVGFDQASQNVFVSRQFQLSVYSLAGQCIGKYNLSCCTKSPVHLVEGYVADRYVLAGETKGGLWLVDPKQASEIIQLQREFHGDAAISATLSPDRRSAAIVFESGRVALLSMTPNGKPALRDFIKDHALFAGFYPERNDLLVTTSDDGWIRRWQISDDQVKETAKYQIPGVAIDWITFSNDREEMLAVGDNRALYVLDGRDGRVLNEVGDAPDIDWATTRAVPIEPSELLPEGVRPSTSVTYPNAGLKVIRSLQAGGRTWVVVENPDQNGIRQVTYLIDGDAALAYPGLGDYEAIEQFGDLFWLKRRDWSNREVGPVVRIVGKELLFYPRNATVNAVAAYQGKVFLATNRGLYAREGTNLTRVIKDTVAVTGLYPYGDQLWIATKQGAYVLEKERLFRVTEPFLDVVAIKQVGGRFWVLTKSGEFASPGGPAYLVADYRARVLPNRKGRVTNVIEAGGRTWLLGSPGLHVLDGERLTEVGPIPQDVIELQEDEGRMIAKTQTRSWPFTSAGPTYAIDLHTLKAVDVATIRGQLEQR